MLLRIAHPHKIRNFFQGHTRAMPFPLNETTFPFKKESMTKDSKILIGMIVGPVGTRGGVRMKSYAHSAHSLNTYKIFQDETGEKHFRLLKVLAEKGDKVTLFLETITTRTQAESLKGTALFVERSQLPPLKQDEFYYEDLKGLLVRTDHHQDVGSIRAVLPQGERAILDVGPFVRPGSSLLIPFHREFVKKINLEEQQVIVDAVYIERLLALHQE